VRSVTLSTWVRRGFHRTPRDADDVVELELAARPTGGEEGKSEPRDDLPAADLPDLGDRFGLKDRLEQALADAPLSGPMPALLLLDLDEFKTVNDSHGRSAGDEVLRLTGSRLLTAVLLHGSAFRVGSDQFVVLLDRTTPDEAVSIASRVLTAVREPMQAHGTTIEVTASIGVVMLGDRRRADGLLRDADVTMYRAKAEGGNRVDIYSRELDDWALSRKRDVDSLAKEVDELRLENQMLTEATITDTGTGLPNSAAFEADHLQLHARHTRSREKYALLVAEIDHLHDSNQRFSLPAGHQALRAVGQTLNGTVRQGDRAYRYGEAEFAALLPGAGMREAVIAAERIRSSVEKLAIAHPANPLGVVTVTVGVIEVGFRHPTAKDVLVELNALLQEGKHTGQNRIVWPGKVQ
jgi:diguanylate cyclase (GGDEF)-like protein